MTTMVQAVANTYRCPVCNHLTCQVNIIIRYADSRTQIIETDPLKTVPEQMKLTRVPLKVHFFHAS